MSAGLDTGKGMALDGLKVLDFTWVAVGPITIKYLADNGATVVRVESVTRRDDLRAAPPCKDGISSINSSQFPAIYNTSKYGLGLNMSKPESQDLIRRLMKEWQPDVVAESFTPVVKKRWGLDYESLKKIKEDIILFSACQQGQTGPKSAFAGFGMQAAAHAGFYHLTGWPDHGPLPPYGAYSDFINPPNGAAAILAALLYRDRTGKGQHIDLAQFECAIQYLSPLALDYQTTGRVMRRNGNSDEAYAPHGIYPCAAPENEPETPIRKGGHWCAIAVTSEEEWGALCESMGTPGLRADPRFESTEKRLENSAALDEIISGWTSRFESRALMERLQGAGVPAGVVQSQSELWNDPQLEHLGFYQMLEHTECGPMPYDGLQFQLSKTPGKLRWAQALVGEHSEMVLKEFAGLDEDEIAELVAAEALEFS